MSGYEPVDPFEELTKWFTLNRERSSSELADDLMNDMFDQGVIVFAYTQIHDVIDTLKELAQEVAWKTYEDNLVL